jgi:hypothetical protein
VEESVRKSNETIGANAPSMSTLGSAATVVAVLLLLCWPALWNGYPLVYHDTEDYVNMSFTYDLVIWRILPYALVMALGRLFDSLWPVVLLQGALATWLLHEAVHAFVPRYRRLTMMAVVGALALATSLPWVVSTLMPDAMTGLVPLGLATAAFGAQLPRWRRLLLPAPLVVAIACHLSHLAIAVGLTAVLALLWLVSAWRKPALRPMLGVPLYAVVVGALLIPAIHKGALGEAFYARGGRVLQLALFVQDGLVKRYLDRVCPAGAALKLCPHRDKLPASADSFLWAHWASPFWKLGGWIGMRDEARKIIVGIVHTFPGDVALIAARNAAHQLGQIRLGDGLDPKRRPNTPGEYYDTGEQRYPGEQGAYLGARQQQGKGIDFVAINAWQQPLAWAGMLLLCLLLADAVRRRDAAASGLATLMLLAILGNAVVCGAFSNPHDRYQNRIVWLAAAADVLLAARALAGLGWRVAPQPAPGLP